LVSAVVYSVFALLPFGGLLAGDVMLYTAALALEFAALVRLRRGGGARGWGAGGARVGRGVPPAGRCAHLGDARGAADRAVGRGRRARGAEPGHRPAGGAGGRGARRPRAAPVCRAGRAPGAARAAARAMTP